MPDAGGRIHHVRDLRGAASRIMAEARAGSIRYTHTRARASGVPLSRAYGDAANCDALSAGDTGAVQAVPSAPHSDSAQSGMSEAAMAAAAPAAEPTRHPPRTQPPSAPGL